jgi:hypothetical protein
MNDDFDDLFRVLDESESAVFQLTGKCSESLPGPPPLENGRTLHRDTDFTEADYDDDDSLAFLACCERRLAPDGSAGFRVNLRVVDALMELGECLCKEGPPLGWIRKARREQMSACICGKHYSNTLARQAGLWSKTEWRKKGYKVKPTEKPRTEIWRCCYKRGCKGGRIGLVPLYDLTQVTPIKRRSKC